MVAGLGKMCTTRNMIKQTLDLLRVQGVSFPVTCADSIFREMFSFVKLNHFSKGYHGSSVPRCKDGIGIPGSTSELDQALS